MTENPHTEAHEPHEHEHPHPPYAKIWVALLVLTVLEYFYAMFLKDYFFRLVVGLMILATIKAGLVAMFFMHLKFEGRWVYLWLAPAGLLVVVFITALYPDIGMQRSAWPDYSDEEEAALAPAVPGPPAALSG